jgi:hypothetical protein
MNRIGQMVFSFRAAQPFPKILVMSDDIVLGGNQDGSMSSFRLLRENIEPTGYRSGCAGVRDAMQCGFERDPILQDQGGREGRPRGLVGEARGRR